MILSYISIFLALSAIYPIFRVMKLAKEREHFHLSMFITIMLASIVLEGAGQLGKLLNLPILNKISIVQNNYTGFCWAIIVLFGYYFIIIGVEEITKTIHHQKLHLDDLKFKLAEMETAQSTGKVLASSSLTLKERLQKSLDLAMSQILAEHGSIMLKNVHGELVIIASTDKDLIGMRKSASFGISAWVVRESKCLNIANVKDDERFKNQVLNKYKKNSFLSVPIKIEKEVIGVLSVNDKIGDDKFSTKDESRLVKLAEKISTLLEKVKYYSRLKQPDVSFNMPVTEHRDSSSEQKIA